MATSSIPLMSMRMALRKDPGPTLAEDHRRDGIVLATKSVSRPGTERRFDASRRHLLAALDGSLRRLGVDCIDLWQLHAWDPWTPIEETLSAVDAAIAAERFDTPEFPTIPDGRSRRQQRFSPLVPRVTHWYPCKLSIRWFSAESNVKYSCFRGTRPGVLPWSPLGRGTLTGKYRNGTLAESRAANPTFSSFVQPYLGEDSRRVVDAGALRLKVLTLNPSKLPSPGSATNPVSAHQSLARGLPHNSRWDSLQTTWNCQLHFGAHWTMSRSLNVATPSLAGTKGKVTHGPIC